MNLSEKLQSAVDHFLPIIKQRKDECGIAWFHDPDSREMINKFEVDSTALGKIYTQIGEHLGSKVERFGRRAHELAFLLPLFRQSEGELTEDVRHRFYSRFPDVSLRGPLVRAARVRLGFGPKPKDTASPLPTFDNGLLNKASRIRAEYDKLDQEQTELEERIEQIKKDKSKYVPMIRKLDELKGALRTIEENERTLMQ
jgi:hypothetical protein